MAHPRSVPASCGRRIEFRWLADQLDLDKVGSQHNWALVGRLERTDRSAVDRELLPDIPGSCPFRCSCVQLRPSAALYFCVFVFSQNLNRNRYLAFKSKVNQPRKITKERERQKANERIRRESYVKIVLKFKKKLNCFELFVFLLETVAEISQQF
jgi:hypothetical protein